MMIVQSVEMYLYMPTEVCTCDATFTPAFADVHAAKGQVTDAVEERLNGITDLQHDLGNTDLPQHLNADPFEDLQVS